MLDDKHRHACVAEPAESPDELGRLASEHGARDQLHPAACGSVLGGALDLCGELDRSKGSGGSPRELGSFASEPRAGDLVVKCVVRKGEELNLLTNSTLPCVTSHLLGSWTCMVDLLVLL